MQSQRHRNWLPVGLFIFATLLHACRTVAITGRQQLNLVPRQTILSLSYQQYGEFLSQARLSTNQEQVELVRRVGKRIQNAVEQYFAEQGLSEELQGYEWEFNLVESSEVNAWCLPGGKVVFYTGILPITKDEEGLAVVMGHEIAHAIAEHGNERMSQGLLTQLGGVALDIALRDKPKETRQLFLVAFGVGAQIGVLLPFSRMQESEADRLGLIFMAMAGYDPRAALEFWKRMASQGGVKLPEFLSTHPSDETRIREIQAALPEALKYYRRR
ncbi:MAG: M48 family metallopeptidase [Chloroherpetonaceae bacterium]|nr:M48 family metallopeptidase [Chloroherpetonaceae bacterium]